MLRLYTFIEWVKEMLDDQTSGLRSDKEGEKGATFHDRVFENEMSKLVNAAAVAYDKMLFKEALKTGFFEMQGSEWTSRQSYDSRWQTSLFLDRTTETKIQVLVTNESLKQVTRVSTRGFMTREN